MHARAGAAQERGTQHKVYTSPQFTYHIVFRCSWAISVQKESPDSNGEQSGSAVLHQASNNMNMSPSCRKWSGVERECVYV